MTIIRQTEQQSFVIEGLRVNTTYTIHLAAVGSGGVGPSITETVTTLEPGNLVICF